VGWIDACHAPGATIDYLTWPDYDWQQILPQSPLEPHKQHYFDLSKNKSVGPYTHVRLNINNGGVSRLRVIGTPV
ncbi:MAG TPA: hypothetical protein V6D17_00775, partial [Candidatus Obscuribacterales bacterium]